MNTIEDSVLKPWLAHYPCDVPHLLDLSEPQTLVAMFEYSVEHYAKHTALHFLGKDISYKHLGKFTRRLSINLSKMGVKKGDRVALLMGNCPQAVLSYYAILMLGAMVVPCNPLYTPRELSEQMSGVSAIITLDFFYLKAKTVASEYGIKNVIVGCFSEFLPLAKSLFFTTRLGYPRVLTKALHKAEERERDCIAHHDEACIIESRKEEVKLKTKLESFEAARKAIHDDAKSIHFFGAQVFRKISEHDWNALPQLFPKLTDGADLIFTSGTTGIWKGAMRTHANLWCHKEQIRHWFSDAQYGKEVFLWVLPVFHTFGVTTMNLCLALGGKLVIVPDASDILSVVENIESQKPTAILGVPKLFMALLKRHKRGKNWSSLKYCVAGGAKLDVSVIAPFEKITGGRLVEGYGLSEAPVTHCNPLRGISKAGSIGIPVPNTDAKIMVKGNNGLWTRVGVGEKGELWVSGPQVMSGYFDTPLETAKVFDVDEHGVVWLKTGDLAYMDKDGFFFICGREKNLIIGDNGLKINPVELEEVIRLHPSVETVCVVGIPIEGKEEYSLATAFVVFRPNMQVTEEELFAYCRRNLAPYKIPRKIIFRKELPLTMKGDVMGYKLREEILAERALK